jgi:hypothetical protein
METYRDRHLVLDDAGLTIRHYYFPAGSKRIRYRDIVAYQRVPASRARLWGSGNSRSWRHRDLARPSRQQEIRLDTGGRVRPVISPRDVDAVWTLLERHVR